MENYHSDDYAAGCCACEDKTLEAATGLTCADKKNIFTRREQEVLGKIREASRLAGALKDEIRQTDERRREAALLELGHLRQIRGELEQERLAAAEERMRMLGHL
ncbi:conserved hypothetical protein [Syntrophobacter sp. SbD1]|nr:conserved hypothetical protein [Syntrophobacter sp. SbD1]